MIKDRLNTFESTKTILMKKDISRVIKPSQKLVEKIKKTMYRNPKAIIHLRRLRTV
jgi:hypothetical protein